MRIRIAKKLEAEELDSEIRGTDCPAVICSRCLKQTPEFGRYCMNCGSMFMENVKWDVKGWFHMRDVKTWDDMRERLMRLTMKQLKQIAKDEHIALGYAASRKDSTVAEIVAQRRTRALDTDAGENVHPWRRYRSVERMHIS